MSPDRLSLLEEEAISIDDDVMRLETHEMHLDPIRDGVVVRVMPKAIDIEVAPILPVEAHERVLVEEGANTAGVVVRGVQNGGILSQIDPEQ